MTRDRIDALAEELFAAAREERPDRELGARVERATLANAGATARLGERRREGGLRGPLLVRVLLAALGCGGLAALVLLTRTHDAVIISAERARDGVAAKPGTPPSAEHAVGERAPAEALAPREALPGAAEPSESHRPLPEPPAAPVETRVSPTEGAPRSPAASTVGRDGPRREATPPMPEDDGAAAPTSASTPTLSKELGAIKQIRQALRNRDGSAALALLERYDSGEYGSSLSLEASVLRVEALDAVGRRAEAEALARRFVRDNPDSPLAERAQRFLDRTDPARRRRPRSGDRAGP